jgi:glycosyltransferase involved in cell wall biosynthesis
MTKLSILIPCYEMKGKGVEMLSYSFNKIRQQTFKDFEIIVSDDSKDEVISSYTLEIKDLNIKYVKNNGNHSIAGNANNAIRNATGQILHIMCQDDYFYNNDSLQKIVDNFDTNKNWMVSTYMHTKDKSELFKLQVPSWNSQIYLINTIGTPSCLSFANDNPIFFDENLTWFVDCEYYYRLYKRYGLPKILEDILFIQYLWEGQTTNTLINQEVVTREELYIKEKYKGEIN